MFSFAKVQQKLNPQKSKQVEEDSQNSKMLEMYKSNKTNPKVQAECAKIQSQYKMKASNHRYFSYHEHLKPSSSISQQQRMQDINKLLNFQLGYKACAKVAEKAEEKIEQDVDRREEVKRIMLMRKFRKNIKLIIGRLKKLKMTFGEVIECNLFSKEVYKFGKDLFGAVKEGQEEKVWRIMMENKFSIFSMDHTYKTPVFWACIRNQEPVLKLLLSRGALADVSDISGHTPLYYAIKYQHHRCVRRLMIQPVSTCQAYSQAATQASQLIRSVYSVGLRLKSNMKRMHVSAREQFFDEQYKYYYPHIYQQYL